MENQNKNNTSKNEKPAGRWRMIYPVFVCTSAFFAALDSPGEISLKNLPNLIVYFFAVLLAAIVLWVVLYAIDASCFGRLEMWISEKLGTNSIWKKVAGFLIKFAVLFISMLVMFCFVNLLQPSA